VATKQEFSIHCAGCGDKAKELMKVYSDAVFQSPKAGLQELKHLINQSDWQKWE
jgi:hypothetical protein